MVSRPAHPGPHGAPPGHGGGRRRQRPPDAACPPGGARRLAAPRGALRARHAEDPGAPPEDSGLDTSGDKRRTQGRRPDVDLDGGERLYRHALRALPAILSARDQPGGARAAAVQPRALPAPAPGRAAPNGGVGADRRSAPPGGARGSGAAPGGRPRRLAWHLPGLHARGAAAAHGHHTRKWGPRGRGTGAVDKTGGTAHAWALRADGGACAHPACR